MLNAKLFFPRLVFPENTERGFSYLSDYTTSYLTISWLRCFCLKKHYCAFSSEKWIKFTLLPLLKMLHNVWLLRWWMRSCLAAAGKSLEHLVVFLLWFALQWFLDAPPPFLHLLLIFYWVFLGCYSFCLYFCSVPSKVWGGAFAPSPLRLELFALSALSQSEL